MSSAKNLMKYRTEFPRLENIHNIFYETLRLFEEDTAEHYVENLIFWIWLSRKTPWKGKTAVPKLCFLPLFLMPSSAWAWDLFSMLLYRIRRWSKKATGVHCSSRWASLPPTGLWIATCYRCSLLHGQWCHQKASVFWAPVNAMCIKRLRVLCVWVFGKLTRFSKLSYQSITDLQ